MDSGLLLAVIFYPMAGALISGMIGRKTKTGRDYFAVFIVVTEFFFLLAANILQQGAEISAPAVCGMGLHLKIDGFRGLYSLIAGFMWMMTILFSGEYFAHYRNRNRYYLFQLVTLGAVIGVFLSADLYTTFIFFEIMSFTSYVWVAQDEKIEALRAAETYLVVAMIGGMALLMGICLLFSYTGTLEIKELYEACKDIGDRRKLYAAGGCMLVGFGAKAGVFPLHIWLPKAHPVAPAPASAVLSAVIVKGGILAVLRSVYYIVGVDIIRGTWVQQTWIVLVLITVFMGSMLAFREPVFKKRLAYSSVSQASYILLGMAVLNPAALTGALMHVLFHALIKTALFLCAGAVIYQTGCTRADELTGIGKKMPVTIWCYTFVSLGLIGIPPMNGFISKWYLMTGMLWSGEGVISWMGPAVLLVSALLTAGYLLPVTIQGFLPGTDYDYGKLKNMEPAKKMTVPIIILASAALITGLFPGRLAQYLETIAEAVL